MAKIQTSGTKRLFNNKILDALTRTHPAIIFGMYVPAIIAILIWDYVEHHQSLLQTFGLFFGGIFFWTFAEYMLHRFLFHMDMKGTIGERAHYLMHGVHHEYPKDKERLVMPPIPSIFMATFLFSIFYLALGTYAYSFFPGFVAGYLLYALMHYLIHAIKVPNQKLMFIWKHHNLHHFKYPDRAFGVSSPFWDYIFRTMPPKSSKT